jgi:peptidyl-prolyl cis-trans isomerase SurA
MRPDIKKSPLRFLLPLVLFLSVASSVSAKELMVDRIAAVVNSEPILLSEIQERLTPETKASLTDILSVLNLLIDQKLEAQAAVKKGLTVTENEVHQAIEETRSRNGLTNDEAFNKSLEKENLTIEKISVEIKNQILLRKLVQREVLSDIVVMDEEVKQYYQNHADLFKIPEKREIIQILFEVRPDDDPKRRAQIKEEANSLSKKLDEGNALESILKESPDLANDLKLSDLGAFRKGELLPALDKTAFDLQPEKWSVPIETDMGVHLIKAQQRGTAVRPLEEVSKDIRERLFQERSETAMMEWMVNLRKSATIDIPLLKEPMITNKESLQ